MLKGLKDFLLGEDIINVAAGLVMALATFALVESLVADLITPLIAAVVGEPDFGALRFTINGSEFRYGSFINAAITFASITTALYFFVIVPYRRYHEHRGIGGETRPCPECTTVVPLAARRCPQCTAVIPSPATQA